MMTFQIQPWMASHLRKIIKIEPKKMPKLFLALKIFVVDKVFVRVFVHHMLNYTAIYLSKQSNQYIGIIHVIINNILLYIMLIMISYIIMKINIVQTNLLKLADMNRNMVAFNSKTKHIDYELHRIKAKSFDIADVNIKLMKTSENLEHELQVVKHKLLCNRNNTQS